MDAKDALAKAEAAAVAAKWAESQAWSALCLAEVAVAPGPAPDAMAAALERMGEDLCQIRMKLHQ